MKTKTINAVVAKKMNDWLNSIEDEDLRKLTRDNIIVTGGSLTSMLLNEPVNDFDIYLKTKECVKRLSQYYVNKFNENNSGRTNKIGKPLKAWVLDGVDVDEWKRGIKKLSSFAYDYTDIEYNKYNQWTESDASKNPADYETEEAKDLVKSYLRVSGMILNTPTDRIKIVINSDGIAEDSDAVADANEYDIDAYLDALGDGDSVDSEVLTESNDGKYKPVFLSTNAITLSNKIQIVIRFYGEPEVIHENYDFIHATNYWTFKTGAVLNQRALESIINKELFYVGSKYPIASLIRTRKFIKRGWQINAGQYVKMAFQISELDLKNIYTLEDQLVGVDSIYFLNFVENLKKLQLQDKNFVVTKDYVTSIIDKIFG